MISVTIDGVVQEVQASGPGSSSNPRVAASNGIVRYFGEAAQDFYWERGRLARTERRQARLISQIRHKQSPIFGDLNGTAITRIIS